MKINKELQPNGGKAKYEYENTLKYNIELFLCRERERGMAFVAIRFM